MVGGGGSLHDEQGLQNQNLASLYHGGWPLQHNGKFELKYRYCNGKNIYRYGLVTLHGTGTGTGTGNGTRTIGNN